MTNKESKRHHYTPEFVMSSWIVTNSTGHKHLNAYYWNQYKGCIDSNSNKGPKAYCFQKYLLTLETKHTEGKDVIERKFFGEVDTSGASIHNELLQSEGAVTNLITDQRCEWARLLLSLDARRPENVSKLTNKGTAFLHDQLNYDQEILNALSEEGMICSPVEYVEKHLYSIRDKAISNIQSMVDNPTVGKVLINAHWHVIELTDNAEPLILSDRPLIKSSRYNSPGAVWVIPISPSKAFIAANHIENLRRLLNVSHRQLSKKLNISSASQADKYVFSVKDDNHSWLEKYMKPENKFPV